MQNIEHNFKKYDKYFITQDFDGDDKKIFLDKIERVLRSGIKIIQFRSKNLSIDQYSEMSKNIFELCKYYNSTYIINDYKNYNKNKYCDGLQFTSKNLKHYHTFTEIKDIFLLGSCHNFEEIDICNSNNFHMITISPIKNTHNKTGIGWDKFRSLSQHAHAPVFALGGLDYNHDINIAIQNGASGIAASSFFYKL